jgi:uncharacterized membrane protein (UPF0127 family)
VVGERLFRAWIALLWAAAAVACTDPGSGPAPAPPKAETAWVEIGDQLFELELALDPQTRFLGMGHRTSVAPDGGMLFAFPESQPLAFVMRDCPIPLDLAFLDASGSIVALYEMQPEPPRAPGEAFLDYESRLPTYTSGGPARFAIETGAGRLAQAGARVGERAVFDTDRLAARAR